MKKVLYLLLLPVLIGSCQRTSDIIYDARELEKMPTVKASLELIPLQRQFAYPETIIPIMDSLLLVFDCNCGDNICHIITKDGRPKASFGMKGKRNIELVNPAYLTVSKSHEMAYVYDINMKKLVWFDMQKLLEGEENEKRADKAEEPFEGFMDLRSFKNIQSEEALSIKAVEALDEADSFLGFATNTQRFIYMHDGKVVSTYQDYPPIDPDEECIWTLWTGAYAVSPNGKNIISTTRLGALVEIIEIDNGAFRQKALKAFYKPKFDIINATPKWTAPTEGSIRGINQLYAGDNYFIGCMPGEDRELATCLLYFDYNGNLLKKVDTGHDINCFTVDGNGDAFVFAYNENDINLYKLQIDAPQE